MPGNYPAYHSLIQKLAGKVITRVVKNGASLSDAIKEAINYAELNRQQAIHLCSILQEYNMPYNGDPMDFFRSSEDLGKGFPNPAEGYVVYASTGSMKPVFGAIEQLKQAGFTSKQIIAMNEDLEPIVNTMDEVDSASEEDGSEEDGRQAAIASFMKGISGEYQLVDSLDAEADEAIAALQSLEKESSSFAPEEEFAIAASSRIKKIAQQLGDAGNDAEKPSPDNIKSLLDDANAPEENVGEDAATATEDAGLDLGGGDMGGELGGEQAPEASSEVSAQISPAPSELKEKLSSKPEWSVDNILSIQKAENFLENIRKELETIVFNENIILDSETVKQYDNIREMIDGELDKIKEAQKETKKLENKENELEEEFEVKDVPTEEMIAPPKEETAAPSEEISVEE